MNAVAVEDRPSTMKYQIRSNVPIPPKGANGGRQFKNPALIAAVDSMLPGDCIGVPGRLEVLQATMRLKKLYGSGSATQRQQGGTYTVWRVK